MSADRPAVIDRRYSNTQAQQHRQHRAVGERSSDVQFDAPVVMQNTETGAEINQAMNHLPTLAAEPADPFFRGGDCEWNEQNEARNTRKNEWALADHVLHNLIPREGLVQPDVRDEVHESVKERKQPQHSAKPYQAGPSNDPPERGDAQRDHQKTQCPDAGPVSDVLNRICAQVSGENIPNKPRHGDQTDHENSRLENPPTIKFGHYRMSVRLAQIHSGVHLSNLVGVSVEHERTSFVKLADPPLGGLAPAGMVHLGIHISEETVLLRCRLVPRRQGLLVRESDFDDRLNSLEAVLPWSHQPDRRPILGESRFSVNAGDQECQRIHRFVHAKAFGVWPVHPRSEYGRPLA